MYNIFAITFKKLVFQEDETSEHNQISDTDFFLGGVMSMQTFRTCIPP